MWKQVKDERIEKESYKIMPAIFWLFSVELLICLLVKLVLGEPWYNFILEILCLASALGYAGVKRSRNGVLFLKKKDEALLTIRNAIMTEAFSVSLGVMLLGELVYMYFVFDVLKIDGVVWSRELVWAMLYLVSWLLPAVIINVFNIKNGWMVWGSKKREITGKKQFAKRTVAMALLLGIVMGLVEFLEHGFSEKVFIVFLLNGIVVGLVCYFVTLLAVKISERNADKSVKEKEESSEE